MAIKGRLPEKYSSTPLGELSPEGSVKPPKWDFFVDGSCYFATAQNISMNLLPDPTR
jgi:hypothetical protein